MASGYNKWYAARVIRVDQEDGPAKLLCIELTLAGRTNGGKEREWQDQQGGVENGVQIHIRMRIVWSSFEGSCSIF
jgi:hypothetical protein